MSALFAVMVGWGVVKIFLETETHNARARRFYTRQSFEIDDLMWMSRDILSG